MGTTSINGVSLVLCCHNSISRLPKTIKHVFAQLLHSQIPWELIIVDNASSDETFQVAKDLTQGAPFDCTIVTEKTIGLCNARVRGIAESKYEFISLVDDDNWVCFDWVQTVYEIMSSFPEVGACGGIGEPAFDSVPPYWFELVFNSFAVGKQCRSTGYVPASRGYLWGAGLTIRKTAWNNLTSKGFRFMLSGREGNKLSSGEDTELCFALRLCGWRLWYDERLKFVHYIPKERLNLIYLKHLYRAFGDASVILDQYKLLIECKPTDKISLMKYYLSNTFKTILTLSKFTIFSQLTISVAESETKNFLRAVYREYEHGRTLSYIKSFPKFVRHLNMIRKYVPE